MDDKYIKWYKLKTADDIKEYLIHTYGNIYNNVYVV
jgi:hypothetical protein